MLGLVKDATGSFTDGLYILGGGVIVGAICVLSFNHAHAWESPPETTAGAL